MGVPKFYRWISERYPCLSQVVKDYQIPEFDNFYLDMNGIIHTCSHPNDEDPTFRISEEKIFSDIFRYLESLFRMIRPQKVLFLAVDGVAPRAKMNQQRGRRFRSAKDAEDLIRKAQQRGKVLPSEPRFDSNCITPGTDFMSRLHEQLKYFVNQKLNSDPSWQRVEVILSGHDVPGEGEHKIMDYIRHQKAKPDFDPNTRHCLYGLDADLLMLGLITHEPHFSLLREEIRFGKKVKSKQATPETITFHLLHLSILREYLDFEFADLKDKLRFPYDLEKIIDDWVLMGFLVGNDFIPHLPNMHIQQDVLPFLYSKYKELLPTLDGYINDGGVLNLEHFEAYLKKLEDFDRNHYRDLIGDINWIAGKRAARMEKKKKKQPPMDESGLLLTSMLDNEDDEENEDEDEEDQEEEEVIDGEASEADAKLMRDLGIKSVDEYFKQEDEDREVTLESDFRKFKANYYEEKMGFVKVDEGVLEEQAKCYVVGIQWILYYYYSGVPSWGWFYPYHYAPFVSDIKDIATLRIEFEQGDPFLPYQQLLSVLPPASKSLLPKAYQGLMLNEDSVLKSFYPIEFATDLNGKQQEWEAVVLIPFIDEELLMEAMKPLTQYLTDEEKRRNRHGSCHEYLYAPEMAPFTYPSPWPTQFPDITNCKVKCRNLSSDPYPTKRDQLVQGLCKGVLLDVFFPGFPSLKHVPHTVHIAKKKVRVFQQASQGDNFCLNILPRTDLPKDAYKYAREMIGQTIYVGWPYLIEAYLWAVSDRKTKYVQDGAHKSKVKVIEHVMTEGEIKQWDEEALNISRQYMEKKGIDVGSIDLMLYVKPLQGRRYVLDKDSSIRGSVCLQKQWSGGVEPFSFQTTVHNIEAHCPQTKAQISTLQDLYPPESSCFLLTAPHYGSMAQVISVDTEQQRVLVKVSPLPEPDINRVIDDRKLSVEYRPSFVVSKELGVHPLTLARITSSIKVERGSRENKRDRERINIGLNWKFSNRNQELPGYTHKSDTNWCFSLAAINLLNKFISRFPQMFEYLNANPKDDVYYEADLFPDPSGPESWSSVQEFLKQLPTYGLKPVSCGSLVLDAPQIAAIEKAVLDMQRQKDLYQVKSVKLRVKPSLLFKSVDTQGNITPDPAAEYQLYDRVVNVSSHNAVPFGLAGTVIGILGDRESREQLCEIVFDEEFLGGIALRCSPNRGYQLPVSCLINLTYGKRLEANHGGTDLPDSGQRGASTPHRASPAGGRGHGGKDDQGRVRSPHVGTSSPGNSVLDSSEKPLWTSKVKGSASSAGKPEKAKKSDAKISSAPRTLLQRQEKKLDEPNGKPSRSTKQHSEQSKNSTDTQKHSGNEFSNMVKEMESHSKKSHIHSTPIPSTTSTASSPATTTAATSTSAATKHHVLRYSQQSISKQRENSDSREAAAKGGSTSMDQAIGALSKLALSGDPSLAGPDPQLTFAPPYEPSKSSLGSFVTGPGTEGGPSMVLKSLLQVGEFPPPPPPGGPSLVPPYFMYGPARQPLLPTPPFHPGPHPPIRGPPPPLDYGYQPPFFPPYAALPPQGPPPPPPPQLDSMRALMYAASVLGYPPPKITAVKDDTGMFVGTVEMGGMKYTGAPSSTKQEAQQIAASIANSALPPLGHQPPFYPSFGYLPPMAPPPHNPYAPPPPQYRYPPPPMSSGPSYYTPVPYHGGAGYSYNPRGPRPIPHSAPPFVPLQVDRRQAKKSTPAVAAGGAETSGTSKTKEEDAVRRNLLDSLNSVVEEAAAPIDRPSNVGAADTVKDPPSASRPPLPTSSSSRGGDSQSSRSNIDSVLAETNDVSSHLQQIEEATSQQAEVLRKLQEVVHTELLQLDASAFAAGKQTDHQQQQVASQDILQSLFVDVGDDGAAYQEAVPSTDGTAGEVVVVGEILGEESLRPSTVQDESTGAPQEVSSDFAANERHGEEFVPRRPKFQLAAHFDS